MCSRQGRAAIIDLQSVFSCRRRAEDITPAAQLLLQDYLGWSVQLYAESPVRGKPQGKDSKWAGALGVPPAERLHWIVLLKLLRPSRPTEDNWIAIEMFDTGVHIRENPHIGPEYEDMICQEQGLLKGETVAAAQAKILPVPRLQEFIKKYPPYRAGSNNCTHFAAAVVELIRSAGVPRST
jgi:hypothetical protein